MSAPADIRAGDPPVKEIVCAWLDAHAIPYDRYDHAAAETIADCRFVSEDVGTYVCKNYFLATRSGSAHCVCIVRPEARLRTSDISKQAGTSRLAFGSDEELHTLLRAYPGAVNPLGVIFDTEKKVRLLMDSALLAWPRLAFHPCDNTASLVFTREVFLDGFLKAVDRELTIVEIHDFL